jgi:hypothetical protein
MAGQTLEEYARKLRAMSRQEFKTEEARSRTNKFGEELVQKERQYRLQKATLQCAIAAAIFGFLGIVATILVGTIK